MMARRRKRPVALEVPPRAIAAVPSAIDGIASIRGIEGEVEHARGLQELRGSLTSQSFLVDIGKVDDRLVFDAVAATQCQALVLATEGYESLARQVEAAALSDLIDVRGLPTDRRSDDDDANLADWVSAMISDASRANREMIVRVSLSGLRPGALDTVMRIVKKYRPTVLLTGLGQEKRPKVVSAMAAHGYVAWLSSDRRTEQSFITDGSVTPRAMLERLSTIDEHVTESWEELERLRGQLHGVNLRYRDAAKAHSRQREQLQLANASLERRTDELSEATDNLARAAERLAAATARALDAQREVANLRSSVTFRVGREVRVASRSAGAAFALPWRLRRVLRTRPSAVIAQDHQLTYEDSLAPAELGIAVQPGQALSTGATSPTPGDAARDAAHQRLTDKLLSVMAERSRGGRSGLRISAIVDEFTETCLAPDCELTNLTRDGWKQELQASQPHVLFVESAWRGSGGTWHNAVSEFGAELRGILAWCNENDVPTVFWNKEDPVHYSTFINTAARFGHVFTTDFDCIPRYKAALAHDRVYLLPFAAQPRFHNPIETESRKSAFSFAGAYYRKYPDRVRDLDSFLDNLPSWRPVDIFDRNLGGENPDYRFPDKYRELIVGTLAPSEIARAYKEYEYGINLNSVKQSQTMFARRVFELLGSNTLTVSNYSRAVDLLFGDLVITTDSGAEAVRRVRDVASDPDAMDRVRLAGLRSVLSQHTYEHRLTYMVEKIVQKDVEHRRLRVALIGVAESQAEGDRLLAAMDSQRDVDVTPIIVVRGRAKVDLPERVSVLREKAASRQHVSAVVSEDFFGIMVPHDHYGPNYALDLMQGSLYSDADVFGKDSYFEMNSDGSPVVVKGVEYRSVESVPVRASIARTLSLAQEMLGALVSECETRTFSGRDQLSLDRFNYCKDAQHGDDSVSRSVDDLALDSGLALSGVQSMAEALRGASVQDENEKLIGPSTLSRIFSGISRPALQHAHDADEWVVTSTLDDGVHDYMYGRGSIPVEDLWAFSGEAHAYVDAEPGLNIQVVFIFHDNAGGRLGAFFAVPQKNASHVIPEGTVAVKVGLRVHGGGVTRIRGIALTPRATLPERIVHAGEHLVLTNHYPAYDDLYRNGFVHTRVRSYIEAGMGVDVFKLRPESMLRYEEFQGVSIMSGSAAALERLLADGSYESVLVHFLDEPMWLALQSASMHRQIVVWIHGAEVQPWWRRSYNYADGDLLNAAKEESGRRMKFWARVFTDAPANVHFVFVSEYFAAEVIGDVGVPLDPDRYSVIHNPIETDVFAFVPKPATQRLKILSIRPFASPKYANDLTVAAIVELSSEPWFDELEFRIIGDGPLFDETLAPVVGFDNVTIERGFLTQSEIVALHREYGVFLVPTRMDAQGVSRDEAMASGLVPITNAVAAIPEFVDAESGILAGDEDFMGLADGIRKLRASPELFTKMSDAAASRVRRQSSAKQVLALEDAVIRGRK